MIVLLWGYYLNISLIRRITVYNKINFFIIIDSYNIIIISFNHLLINQTILCVNSIPDFRILKTHPLPVLV